MSIIPLAFLAFAVIILAICLLKNMLRPLSKSVTSAIILVISFFVAFFVTKAIGGTVTNELLNSLLPQVLPEGFDMAAIPVSAGVAAALVKMLLVALLFPLCFFFIRLILSIFGGLIRHPLEKTGEAFKKKNALVGLIIGVFSAWLILMVYLNPLVGFVGILSDTVDALDQETLETKVIDDGADSVTLAAVNEEYIAPVNDGVVFKILSKTGAKTLFDLLTTEKVEGEKMVLSDEMGGLTLTALKAKNLVLDNNFDIENLNQDQLDAISSFDECFEASAMLRLVGAEFASGISAAWLENEAFVGIARPEMDGTINVVMNGILSMLKDANKDNITSKVRALSGTAATALQMMSIMNEAENIKDMDLDAIADVITNLATDESSADLLASVMQVGIDMLADGLGLYENKEEIGTSFTEALAAISDEHLTVGDATAEIIKLKEKFVIDMSDADCRALAEAIVAFPFTNPSSSTKAGEPQLVFCSLVTIAETTENDAMAAWLASLKQQENVPEWIDKPEETPTKLMTKEDLGELMTSDVFTQMTSEDKAELVRSAVEIVKTISSGESMDVTAVLDSMGSVMSALSSTEAGKELASGLITGAMQSETVREAIGLSAEEATQMAEALSNTEALDNIKETTAALNGLLNTINKLQEKKTFNPTEEDLDNLLVVVNNMTEGTANTLKNLCTVSVLTKNGFGEAQAQACVTFLSSLLDNMVKVRAEEGSEYESEVSTVYQMLTMLMTGADMDFDAAELLGKVCDSKILNGTVIESVAEICPNGEDPFGLHTNASLNALRDALDADKNAAHAAMIDALRKLVGAKVN